MKNKIYKSLSVGIGCAIVASASFALINPENNQQPAATEIALPAPIDIATPEIIEEDASLAPPQFISKNHIIQPGDSLSLIFSKFDLDKSTLHKIIHSNPIGKQFANIVPGKILQIKTNNNSELEQLIYKKSAIQTLTAIRDGDDFKVDLHRKKIEYKTSSSQATIQNSLYLDGKTAGLPDKLIMQLAEIFAWDIDFALSLRANDQFTVLYEKLYVDDKEIDTGNIIAAEFVNQGRILTAVRYEDKNGRTNYYTPDGNSMRKAFLRSPVDFARISSHFNLKRKHPVLNRIRAHKGVDYAARTGTPIKVTGDGKITYRGRKGGYGRVVIVQHGESYSTLYAHLSKYRKGQRRGQHVKQGQVIGYVGKSGLATGPHLHYEFRVSGRHRNPLTVKLPHSAPIKKEYLANFKLQTQPLLIQLDQAKTTLLAKNEL